MDYIKHINNAEDLEMKIVDKEMFIDSQKIAKVAVNKNDEYRWFVAMECLKLAYGL